MSALAVPGSDVALTSGCLMSDVMMSWFSQLTRNKSVKIWEVYGCYELIVLKDDESIPTCVAPSGGDSLPKLV